MSRFVMLLPPSEGKALDSSTGMPVSFTSGKFPELGPFRQKIANRLKADVQHGRGPVLFGVKGDALARAQASAIAGFEGMPGLPAYRRYTGVVWQALAPETLPKAAAAKAQRGIIVVSGLWGLVGFDDPLPDYRLRIGVRLSNIGSVTQFWKTQAAYALNRVAQGATVIDMLPHEHRKVIDEGAVRGARHWWQIDITRQDGKPAGHGGKTAKGKLARELVQARTDDVARILRQQGTIAEVGNYRRVTIKL